MVGRNIVDTFSGYPDIYELLTPVRADLDLLDAKAVKNYVAVAKPDVVIHAAGKVGGIQANMANPVTFLVDNTYMGLNVLSAAYEIGVDRVINVASSCMYPREAENPLVESAILTAPLEPTNEGYAIAKITTQRFCSYANSELDSKRFITLIPCNLYGKYDSFQPQKSHMIPAVIRKIHEAAQNNQKTVEIWGDGTARREFMYAGDLARFLHFAIEHFSELPETVNVGLGYDYSINEYYTAIAQVVGFEGSFEHDLSKPVGMKQKLVDTSIINSLGWKPSVSLKDGIQSAYNYFLETYNE